MAATFPGGVKVFTTKQAGDQIASAHINDLQDEVVAVETELRKTTGSVVSHGSLAGLSNNDHPQYLLTTGKAADSDKLDGIDSTGFATAEHNHDHGDLTGLEDNDHPQYGRPVFLTSAKTSTAWQGKVCSTTAKTKIDLSDVFGVPAGVKAVLASANIKDSGSVAADAWLVLSPVDIAYDGVWVTCSGIANDKLVASGTIIVPCDSNGDIYYQTKASGTDTLTVDLAIYGWWL